MRSATPETEAQTFALSKWSRKAAGSVAHTGRVRRGWVVELADGRYAILERSRNQLGPPDRLRLSTWTGTCWERYDPQEHYSFGSFLPSEYSVSGEVAEIDDGDFVFRSQSTARKPSEEFVGSVLRRVAWLEET